jgi:hypothetical protein
MDADTKVKLDKIGEQLEQIAGGRLNPGQWPNLDYPIASHTYLARHDSDNDAWVTKQQLFIFPGSSFSADDRLLDSSGLSATGADGTVVFRLRNFFSSRAYGLQQFSVHEPVYVVATPQGQKPYYVTIAHQIITPYNEPTDVEFTGSTWNPNGSPAANVWFYWRCRVPVEIVI